ncbi:hypothetical protein H0264_04355 [Nocardia huaxiensis]|uniref:Uncharacterized protein n=1 Tax=Nocardia huaxiensis TaxID=2755382 RepID=A0A7D6VJR8_9NOCA|nr:hypothetical protein [Nocardia huaxiensis]QLY31576.1 hypothetical protein H0264_04355 [Nocardia huaxiensis]
MAVNSRFKRGAVWVAAGVVFAGLTTYSGASAETGGCGLIGTVGTPELGADDTTAGLEALPAANIALPEQIYFRTSAESFNRRWSFSARDGHIYVKEAAAQGGWRNLPLPGCMEGRIAGVSADDDEVMAIDRDGRFFTMDHALSAPEDWNWSERYGTPLWTGAGNTLPAGTLDWTWSVLSPNEDHVWRDNAGNDHPVGGAKVSHVFALTGGGSRISYVDPWLPVDHSYEFATPANGRFRAVKLSTSASTTLVVNRFGDLYTRLYDFDISGADKVFFRYSYEDQRGLPEAPDMLSERIDSRYAAIQLPAPDWVRQPKVPGEITDRISVHKTGIGSDARELRVEGRSDGRTGYWVKTLTAAQWSFVPTDQPLAGNPLQNTTDDRSIDDSIQPSPYSYAGSAGTWTASVENFDVSNTPTLRIDFGDGARLDLILHTVDGLRQLPQQQGIGTQARRFDGTIEVPAEVLGSLATQPDSVRQFLASALGGRRFTDTAVDVTVSEFRIDGLGVVLVRTPPGPPAR